MENKRYYISNEPFYIRAEKILGRKFSECSNSGIFQLCSIIRGFLVLRDIRKGRVDKYKPDGIGVKAHIYQNGISSLNLWECLTSLCRNLILISYFILGVTKRYSATIIKMVVSPSIEKYNRQRWQRPVNLLFGQSQQAVFTTKVVHAFFILPVVSMVRCGLDIDCFRINQPRPRKQRVFLYSKINTQFRSLT